MQYFIGDVVRLNSKGFNIRNLLPAEMRSAAGAAMTICGIDGSGGVKCVWFDKHHQLHRATFRENWLQLLSMIVSIPPDVLCEIQRWKNLTSTL